ALRARTFDHRPPRRLYIIYLTYELCHGGVANSAMLGGVDDETVTCQRMESAMSSTHSCARRTSSPSVTAALPSSCASAVSTCSMRSMSTPGRWTADTDAVLSAAKR